MAVKLYDPLHFVPSPDVVRAKLLETLTLAERLRLLLDLAERLQLPLVTAADITPGEKTKGVCNG